MIGGPLRNLITEHKKTAITMIIGLVAGPIVCVMLNDYSSITPKRLASLLEDKASVVQLALTNSEDSIDGFNKLREDFRQPITLENIDLYRRNLHGVNLNSVTILHSDLSGATLENAILNNAQISSDLSHVNMTHQASLTLI